MSSYDPRQLKATLEDLQDYLQIWSSVARDTLDQANYVQRMKKEHVERAAHRAAIVRNQAQEDEQLTRAKKSQYDSVAVKCIEAVNTGRETVNKSLEALNNALHTLTVWQSELEKALAWLERALRRLEAAQRQYEIARFNVEKAEAKLQSAKRDYERCRRDSNRKNCSGELRAVEEAQAAFKYAQLQLEEAIQELKAAQLEVQQAQARVACCQRAVQFAEQAVKLAQNNLELAQQAEKLSAIGLELSDIVQKSANQAQFVLKKELKVAEALTFTVREAFTLAEEAQLHLAEASNLEDAAQAYISSANVEITNRIEILIELNRPVSELWAVETAKDEAKINQNRHEQLADKLIRFEDLKPDTAYEKNGYTFKTDESKRVIKVSGILEKKEGVRTTEQTKIGHLGKPKDEGGHLIGARFNGPPDAFNLVPQDAHLNHSGWKKMENKWDEALKQGREVRVTIEPIYRGNSIRPSSFVVQYRIAREEFSQSFRNCSKE